MLNIVTEPRANKKMLEIINEQYLDHENDEEVYVTNDNKLVSWGWKRKANYYTPLVFFVNGRTFRLKYL